MNNKERLEKLSALSRKFGDACASLDSFLETSPDIYDAAARDRLTELEERVSVVAQEWGEFTQREERVECLHS